MNFKHFLITFVFLSGCDHFPRHLYKFEENSLNLSAEVCEELQSIGSNHSLDKRENKQPSTFCYFSDSDQNNIVIGARKIGNQLVVDVQGFNHRKEIVSLKKEVEFMLSKKYPNVEFERTK